MRVWIEIKYGLLYIVSNVFHPLMRVWIEITRIHDRVIKKAVSPSYEGVD